MSLKSSDRAPRKKSLLSNSSSLVASRLVQSVSAFLVLAYIARTLGSGGLGQYTLAFSYYLVCMTLVSSGFKTLFTREIARNPADASTYLVSGTFLQLLFGILGYGLLCLVAGLMPYTHTTTVVCLVTGLAIIPFSLSNVVEAIFQAQERMHCIAACTIPVYIARTILMISLLSVGYGVVDIASIFVISEVIIFVLEWLIIQKIVTPQWRINKEFVWKTCLSARTFLAIDGIAVFRERMQIFILSVVASESTIGLFGAVLQLMQPAQILSNSIVLASFPSMSKAATLDSDRQRALTEKTIEMLLFVALPMFIGFLFLGRDLLLFVYRDASFTAAAGVLCVVAFGMITRAFNQPLSYTLVANRLEKVNLFEVINGTILGGLISLMLVSQYQLNGAAIAILLVKVCASGIYLYAVTKHLFTLRLIRVLTRPLAVSFLMLFVFWLSNIFSPNFLISLIGVTAAYCFIMLAILLPSSPSLKKWLPRHF